MENSRWMTIIENLLDGGPLDEKKRHLSMAASFAQCSYSGRWRDDDLLAGLIVSHEQFEVAREITESTSMSVSTHGAPLAGHLAYLSNR